MGRYTEAQSHLAECLAIGREIGAKEMIAMVLQPLGMVSLGLGETAAAREYFMEALSLAEELGNKRELAAAVNALAQLHRADGELDAATPLYEKVLSLARELGDREIIGIGLLNLAMVSITGGAADRAPRMLLEALAIVEEIGMKQLGQSLLDVSAGLAVSMTDWERAARFFGAAEAQTAQTGQHRDPTDDAFLAPLIGQALTALGFAAFTKAETGGRALSYDKAIEETRTWLEEQA